MEKYEHQSFPHNRHKNLFKIVDLKAKIIKYLIKDLGRYLLGI